jgi:hypothetical protein
VQPKGSVFFKVMINRFHPGINPAFFKSLPSDQVKEAFAVNTASLDTSIVFSWANELITRTHYSWLAPSIQKLPENLKIPVINALPEAQARGIKSLLKIKANSCPLTPNMRSFLIGQLYRQWNPENALPPEFLPPSPLDPLNSLSKNEIVDLIELLGIYDLAEAIRHIVDKKNLKAIYLSLPTDRQQFLREALHRKEKLAAPKLDIAKWDGSGEQLKAILHRRGLLRLGKALCGQNPQFLWNVTHTLDTGRGKALLEYYKEEQIPGITNLLIQQVITVINFLKQKSST